MFMEWAGIGKFCGPLLTSNMRLAPIKNNVAVYNCTEHNCEVHCSVQSTCPAGQYYAYYPVQYPFTGSLVFIIFRIGGDFRLICLEESSDVVSQLRC